mgnify:CR=1 FL=1
MNNQDIVENFKDVVLDMHRGIPQQYYFGYLEKLIPNEEIRKYFFDNGVFVKSRHKHQNGQDQYFLGINGIILANSYKMERLSDETRRLNVVIKRLTWVMTGLALLTLIATVVSFFLSS